MLITFGTLSICFISLAGIYRNLVHERAILDLETEVAEHAQSQARSLENELQKFSLLPLALSEHPDVYSALLVRSPEAVLELNQKLAALALQTGAPYIYVIDAEGSTIASSNYANEASFVGRNYRFRPYFQGALSSGEANYFAKGERTGKAGLFLAQRIDLDGEALGVLVVKVEFEEIASLWGLTGATTFVSDSNGIILFSSDRQLNFKTLAPLPEKLRQTVINSKQFGDDQLLPADIAPNTNVVGTDTQKNRVLTAKIELPDLGWELYRMEQVDPAIQQANLQVRLRVLTAAIFLIVIAIITGIRVSRSRQQTMATERLRTEVARQTRKLSEANAKLEFEIAQREKINARFRVAREELAQANRLGSIGAITAGVAHEINQPVAAIQAFAENASKFIDRDNLPNAMKNLSAIVELTRKIGTITTELRRYARRGSHAIEDISIADVIDGVDLLIGDRIRRANVDFHVFGVSNELPDV